MGRLQGVAIRKPGDLPARLYGAAASMRPRPMPRGIGSTFSRGIVPAFSDAGFMPLFVMRSRFRHPRNGALFFAASRHRRKAKAVQANQEVKKIGDIKRGSASGFKRLPSPSSTPSPRGNQNIQFHLPPSPREGDRRRRWKESSPPPRAPAQSGRAQFQPRDFHISSERTFP